MFGSGTDLSGLDAGVSSTGISGLSSPVAVFAFPSSSRGSSSPLFEPDSELSGCVSPAAESGEVSEFSAVGFVSFFLPSFGSPLS